MFRKTIITISTLVIVLSFAVVANAAPGLCITKPPVIGPNNTGPPIDPTAQKGQWFLNLWTGEEEYRPCEFYDNVHEPDGNPPILAGGGWASCRAIRGYVRSIDLDPINNNITGFWLEVYITNDMPALSPWWDGYNSHEEWLSTQEQVGEEEEVPMLNVKWTAEFADNSIIGDFPMVGWPYWPAQPPFDWAGSIESNIFAFSFMEEEGGYDQLAWYCWTPDTVDPGFEGQYMVPTWDFGDIHPGQTVSRMIHFRLRMPVDPAHPLYLLLEEIDILLNRTSSLKISDYFDVLWYDFCIPYPHEVDEWPFTSSDCSVFFDVEQPEPPVIDDIFRWPTDEIEIVWLCDPNPGLNYRVESSTNPYDYNEAMMTWTTEAILPGMPPVMSWVDPNPPPIIGIEKYYRIWVQGPCGIETRAADTVGAMTIVCLNGRNMVSTPLEPYPDGGLSGGGPMGKASLDKIVGNQLTGQLFNGFLSDWIEYWDNDNNTYIRAWYKVLINQWQNWYGGPPLFGIDADVGYWFNLVLTHGPSNVTFCGRVSKTNRSIEVMIGRNLVGTCFPVSCALGDSGLVASGFTGQFFNSLFSDNIEFYNNATAAYERFWYKTATSTWKPWYPDDPMRDFQPGDAFWLNVINLAGHAGFTWFYPVP